MIPLASAAINSISLLDYLLWGVVALVVQLLLFAAVKIYMPRISDKIEANHRPPGFSWGRLRQRRRVECGLHELLKV